MRKVDPKLVTEHWGQVDPKDIYENTPEYKRDMEKYRFEHLGGARLQPTLPGLERIPLDFDLCGACFGRGCNLCDYEGVVPKSGTLESGPMEEDRIQ